MTLVSNDPSWWPIVNANRIFSYFIVASSAGMMYDWVLTFGREVELIWRQRWSLMTVLYLSVRYVGIAYVVITILLNVPTISVTDVSCQIMYIAINWIEAIINAILGFIMITRLLAMYQRSRKMLIVLVVVFLAVNVTVGAILVLSMARKDISGEEFDLSGTYGCAIDLEGDTILLYAVTWILGTVWEVLTLCLALWIAVKHFRDLRRQSAGGIIGDCFTVLMETHLVYFASIVAVSCVNLSYLSPTISVDPGSLESQIYIGVSQILLPVQMFVLGPRLILGVREYHAELVVDSDAAPGMASIVFQERIHVSTSSTV